jgi:glycosyltransferase involved in cell wall biosynthesis
MPTKFRAENLTPVVSCVIPCLNEAESLPTVIQEILNSNLAKVWDCEIVVADNGSTDGSQELARSNGARVVLIETKGYGSALLGGIHAAQGKWIIIGDADGSYSFSEAEEMIRLLNEGYDLVMGNRFQGGISPGAMPWLHKYLGNPVLSFLGRKLFKIGIKDFHCGLRAFSKSQILSIGLNSKGMEFASEMLVKASKFELKIGEVPVTLKPDLRSRPPHLRTWRDGWRHLRFLLAYSPKWMFLTPALVGLVAGFAVLTLGTFGKISSNGIEISYKTSIVITGFVISSAVFASALGIARLILNPKRKYFQFHTEVYSFVGLTLILIGSAGTFFQFLQWKSDQFGAQPIDFNLLRTVLYSGMIGVGSIFVVHGFLTGLIRSQNND